MRSPQLTVIDKDRQDIVSLHGETVTIHLVHDTIRGRDGTTSLQGFHLLDDPSVECIPKIKSKDRRVTDFEIHFVNIVPSTYLYEISLFLIRKERVLKHIGTLNARHIFPETILRFPNIDCASTDRNSSTPQCYSVIDGSLAFFTKICRKDIPYSFGNKSKILSPSQITDCSSLFENGTLSNFTICIDNSVFRVHKDILAAKSPVFLTMFKEEMKEKKENLVTIEDIEADVFRELLRYIYVNNVHDLEVHAEKLLQAADKYDIPKLKSLCTDELTCSLKIENAIRTLVLADRHNEITLKKRTITFIVENLKYFLETEEYKTWSLSAPHHLLASILQGVSLLVEKCFKRQF